MQLTVAPELLPVYVLGKDISAAAVTRGLSSLVSSSALKMLARSPTAFAAALSDDQQDSMAAQLADASTSSTSNSSLSDGGDDASSITSNSSCSSEDEQGVGAHISRLHRHNAEFGLSVMRAKIRAPLALSPQQQAQVTDGVRAKLCVLQERCRIYTLCSSGGAELTAEA
jgi:hypothetical protein